MTQFNHSAIIRVVPKKRGRPKEEKRVRANFYIKPVVLKKIDSLAADSSRGKVVESKFESQ